MHPLPKDPDISPLEDRLGLLGPAFGILAAPCLVTELSGKPEGGVTRLCLPFISVAGMCQPTATSDLVQPMLHGVGALVWNLAREV